jgi:cytochrome c oxidase cbb3-type subunit III
MGLAPVLLLLNILGCNNHGAEVYAEFCGICHGESGEGYLADRANALASPEFLATADDVFLRSAIIDGRPTTSMSAWGEENGGPLTTEDVDPLVDFIRAWQVAESVDVDDIVVEGDGERVTTLYIETCSACHGLDGEGGTALSLNNPEFLATASDGFIQYAILYGRSTTPMPGYQGVLSEQEVDDLVVLIRDWEE